MSCVFLFIANHFQFSEVGIQYLRNLKRNEYMKNILFLKMFHQEIVLHDIANQYFLIIHFQLFLCDISKKHISSNITPKNFMDGVFSINLFPIFNVSNFKGIVSLIEFL